MEAYGKNLFHPFEEDGGLRTHLGMQGKWIRLAGDSSPRPRCGCAWPRRGSWDLTAPATCELMDGAGWDQLVASLDPDPLAGGDGEERAWKAVVAFAGTVGTALLDQSVSAGNVLRAESLFRAGVHPSTPAAIDCPACQPR